MLLVDILHVWPNHPDCIDDRCPSHTSFAHWQAVPLGDSVVNSHLSAASGDGLHTGIARRLRYIKSPMNLQPKSDRF